MKTSELTTESLHAYFKEHVEYEMWMLFAIKDSISLEDQVSRNARVESFAIHLRNLITFFYPTQNTKTTDVYARDFFTNKSEWIDSCPVISTKLIKARERAHREVGHLTTHRISGTPKEKAWDMTDLCEEILPIIRFFYVSARPAPLPGFFREVP